MDNLKGSGHPSDPPVPADQVKTARLELERALSFHIRGETAAALRAMRKALALDPGLAKDRLAGNLAQELTGLPVDEALDQLKSEQAGRDLVQAARREQERRPPSFRSIVVTVMLVLASLVLVGLSVRAAQSGAFDSFLTTIRILGWERQTHSLGAYDYYALVPSGQPPDEGWPVVVALHGMDGHGRHMLPFAQAFLEKDILFIAPTFGPYEPARRGPIDEMSRILKEVGREHPLQARGAVLLGHSQGGTFAYRFSLLHPEQVGGVVTAGAPEFDAMYPANSGMPYVFTWGEFDWLQEFMLPPSFAMRSRGYNVRIYIVEGAGHEMTDFAVEQAITLLVED